MVFITIFKWINIRFDLVENLGSNYMLILKLWLTNDHLINTLIDIS